MARLSQTSVVGIVLRAEAARWSDASGDSPVKEAQLLDAGPSSEGDTKQLDKRSTGVNEGEDHTNLSAEGLGEDHVTAGEESQNSEAAPSSSPNTDRRWVSYDKGRAR
ncbi:hypothetical protein V865_004018 [Kwoniella europaea PYCC6329]|uniref:Uncharacterized protein n=1 Tax=Kwoniella europaea PYCC6329 TaxID=1423913 RepID=A0AAX4KKU1_9TREE